MVSHRNAPRPRLSPRLLLTALCLFVLGGFCQAAHAQPLVRAWSNVEGIRIDGHVYVTDADREMEEIALIPVSGGEAQFTLEAASFTSLFSAE